MSTRHYLKSFHSHYRYQQAMGRPRNAVTSASKHMRYSFDDFLEEQRVRVCNTLTAISIKIRAAHMDEDEGDTDPWCGIGSAEYHPSTQLHTQTLGQTRPTNMKGRS